MMKKTVWALLACVLLLVCGMAHAQTLPSNEIFSPGLVRLAELEKAQPHVSAQAQVSISKAAYARDLSVLGAMLDGMTIAYEGGTDGETIAFYRGGEELGTYTLPASEAMDGLEAQLLGAAVLERVPLESLAAWLEGLKADDALALGFCVSEPFTLERTMSDDGTRLTKINVKGAIAKEGQAPYVVEGFLRQPAGRAPKDTFELKFTQDEANYIELLYSALRENEVTRKDKEGTASVRTTLKAAGKIAGSGISSRLTVTMKNRWTADGEALSERVSITATLAHEDRTPGRRMQRLNDVAAEVKNVIQLTTSEADSSEIALTDEISVDVTLDSNAFLTAGAEVSMRVGAQAALPAADAQPIDDAAAKALAQKVYRQLDEKTMETIRKGL